ncbi:MAG TPA: hypothetical protein VLH84_05370 [Patescibacteria group bacterium]|nr:hypothetical protein [Patescibacteria group bacterium]
MTNYNAALSPYPHTTCGDERVNDAHLSGLQTDFALDMAKAAPDLNSKDLAARFAQSLFDKLTQDGANDTESLITKGAQAFYAVGREAIGPLAVSFVDAVLQDCPGGTVIFPARDATPFYHIAQKLITLGGQKYPVQADDLHNPVFNRQLWGVDDEQDEAGSTSEIQDPLVQRLLVELGFTSSRPISFVEVGAWGTMVDSLKSAMQAGTMAEQPFSVYFLYSHMPDNIYGFLNAHCPNSTNGELETIADSFEALPKTFMRPTKLRVTNAGHIEPDLTGKIIPSPFLQPWSDAIRAGFVDAANDYVLGGQLMDVPAEIVRLGNLSVLAASGDFTGILPDHTETWSGGEAWKQNWKWGKTLPLTQEVHHVSYIV